MPLLENSPIDFRRQNRVLLRLCLPVIIICLIFGIRQTEYKWFFVIRANAEFVFPVFVHSVIYFRRAQSFGNSPSVVMIAVAPWNLTILHSKRINFSCVSQMRKDNQAWAMIREPANVSYIMQQSHCKWAAMLMVCKVTDRMAKFAMSNRLSGDVELPFRLPASTRREFVVCYPSIFLFETWQILFAAIEIYRYHKASLLSLPIDSVLDSLMRILKEYVAIGFVEIRPWGQVKLEDDSVLDYDPKMELVFCDQLSPINDCLYQFKEVTEFIAIVDPDDVLLMPAEMSGITMLRYTLALYPNASSFVFPWTPLDISFALEPDQYSIDDALKNSKKRPSYQPGKYVVIPKRIKKLAYHFPVMTEDGFVDLYLNSTTVLHIRYANFSSETKHRHNDSSGIFDQRFHQFLRQRGVIAPFLQLPRLPIYRAYIQNCSQYLQKHQKSICYTYQQCDKPDPVPDLRCWGTLSQYQHYDLDEASGVTPLMKRYNFQALSTFLVILIATVVFVCSFILFTLDEKQQVLELQRQQLEQAQYHVDEAVINKTALRKLARQPVSVFCYTLTASVNHETRIPAVNDTWAKRCDDHYFFTDGPMPRGYKHFVTHRMLTDRNSAWKKLRIVIPFIIRNISADFEWYIRTSDDAFYIIENLRYFLKDFDPDVKHYFGFHMKPNLPRGYVSGSAIVFSRAMMRFLTDTIIPDKIRCPEDQSSIPEYRFDDVAIASCLAAYGLYPEEARDSGFRELFHPFNHSEMYRGGNYHGLVLHSKRPVKNGFDAFSPVLISSHYLTPQEMRLYETLLYQVNVMTQFSRGIRLV